jgi:polar amino acid transport system permease protein
VTIAALWTHWSDYLPTLGQGLAQSLRRCAASLAVGLPIGLTLALASSAPTRAARWPAIVLVEAGRALPAVILLQLAYYGLPSVGVVLSNFVAGTAALGWITAAYSSEMFRGGIASVHEGQREGAQALGVGRFDMYRSIIIPQGTRVALPALLGLAIQTFQATALAFTIGFPELMSGAYDLGNQDFRFLSVLTLAGLLYTAVVLPASFVVRRLEIRMGRHIAAELR